MNGIKQWIRMAALTLALLAAAGAGSAFAGTNGGGLYIEDQKSDLGRQLWLADGMTYAPVKELAEELGWTLSYDADSGKIAVSDEWGDKLAFRPGQSVITYNGEMYDIPQAVKVRDGNAYLPLRLLAESMHASVGWQNEEQASVVRPVEPYVVQSGDTLAGIAQAYGRTVKALMARNGLESQKVEEGRKLKVIVPEFLDPTTADLALLAKIIQVEAGYEPYEGKLAIANVVLNRVNSGKFPDTVRGVIYAAGQFPPALNGDLLTETASAECIQAARAALDGENNVPGALYFFNPKMEPAKAKKARVVKTIGHHMFTK